MTPPGIAQAVIDDRWRGPKSRGRETIEAEITTSATYCLAGGPRAGISFREAGVDVYDARRLHLHMEPDKARALARSLVEMARSAEEMEQAERIRTHGKLHAIDSGHFDPDERPQVDQDEYGNPSTLIQVTIGGKASPARAVHIPIGGRYGLGGCKIAGEPMIEIQPWPSPDGSTWRGGGFRWSVDVLNGRSRWASGHATRDGLCVHGGDFSGHDPRISTGPDQIRRAFEAFNLDTNPNNERQGG